MADGRTQMFDASVQTTTVSVGDGAITDSARQVVMANNPLFRRCFKRKPLEVVHAEEEEGVLERTLGFWDLFALGFGGTVGRFGLVLCLRNALELGCDRDADCCVEVSKYQRQKRVDGMASAIFDQKERVFRGTMMRTRSSVLVCVIALVAQEATILRYSRRYTEQYR